MNFVIVGAGAVGAYIGASLARAGEDVTLFARGPHLEAMKRDGVRVIGEDGQFVVHPNVSNDLESIGPADVVVLAVKTHSLPSLAVNLKPLLRTETVVISTQNGIPWWYFQGHDGDLAGLHLKSVDPEGVIAGAIDQKHVLGSIVYFSTEITEPGVVRHVEGNRLSLGEPDGARSDRCKTVAALLNKSGLKCRVTTQIRNEIWVKLLGNVALNPTSALTRSTIAEMLEHKEVRDLTRTVMGEVAAVALGLGVRLPITVEKRIAGAEIYGSHKTSMLQDLEAGRSMELDAVVGAVVELGRRLDIPVPCTETLYACTKLISRPQEKR